jgi:Family of unknown function (DUF6221)
MTDLAEFVLARIDEDEVMARKAGEPVWTAETAWRQGQAYGVRDQMFYMGLVRPVFIDSEDSEGWIGGGEACEHAARWDPARVLAECDAKRRIVELYGGWADAVEEHVLELLALPYADHPDYQESWKP